MNEFNLCRNLLLLFVPYSFTICLSSRWYFFNQPPLPLPQFLMASKHFPFNLSSLMQIQRSSRQQGAKEKKLEWLRTMKVWKLGNIFINEITHSFIYQIQISHIYTLQYAMLTYNIICFLFRNECREAVGYVASRRSGRRIGK